jgi:polysaccharide deacetylase family protein (PEP-CTERM system associated)
MKILTFDIEEWFLSTSNKRNPPSTWSGFENRVEKNTNAILEMLETKNVHATFFILGWIAEKYPELVQRIAAAGHEIGYHTYYHQRLSEFTLNDFKADLIRGIGLLEQLTGKKVTAFRAPFFALDHNSIWIYEVLAEQGILVSSSVKAGVDAGNIQFRNKPEMLRKYGDGIVEFPLNRAKFLGLPYQFTGGGYFRVLPYHLLRRLIKSRGYIMTYFHPRDFDADLRYSKNLSLMRNFRNIAGAKSGLRKFEWLLDTFDFMTIGEARQDFLSGKTKSEK